jgi:hypothetical protein
MVPTWVLVHHFSLKDIPLQLTQKENEEEIMQSSSHLLYFKYDLWRKHVSFPPKRKYQLRK